MQNGDFSLNFVNKGYLIIATNFKKEHCISKPPEMTRCSNLYIYILKLCEWLNVQQRSFCLQVSGFSAFNFTLQLHMGCSLIFRM